MPIRLLDSGPNPTEVDPGPDSSERFEDPMPTPLEGETFMQATGSNPEDPRPHLSQDEASSFFSSDIRLYHVQKSNMPL